MQHKVVHLSALYVPTMCTCLLSISQHIQYEGCSFYAAQNRAYLTFPTFFLDIINGAELQIPVKFTPSLQPIFDKTSATLTMQSKITNKLQLQVAHPLNIIPNPSQWQKSMVKFKKLTPHATFSILRK